MKIILDTDGTLTDFNEWIKENAIPYFQEKYGMKVIYPNELEIEDIFDMKETIIRDKNCSEKEAEEAMKKMLDEFWISMRFVKFSLLSKFRDGVSEKINEYMKQGHDIHVHTSRAKTCRNDIIGKIARNFTIWQYYRNGIFLPRNHFHFYPNDEEKIKGIIAEHPDLVFEDKKGIIDELSQVEIRTVCVNGNHNIKVTEAKYVQKISKFTEDDLDKKINLLLNKKLVYYNRTAKSDIFYEKIKFVIPIILSKFKPYVIHSENLIRVNNEPVIYAPNHRSTLDPLIITSLINKNIHWAALLRFFAGEDSIFNNSKNSILCKITADMFKSLEYFPIERTSDNPKANNLQSMKDMDSFLKINSQIGIFAEGTTRRPEGSDFGTFDPAFLTLAKRNNVWIQPITSLWIKELDLKNKLIVNYGEAFKVGNKNIEDAMTYFLQIQKQSLEENKKVYSELTEGNLKLSKKMLK